MGGRQLRARRDHRHEGPDLHLLDAHEAEDAVICDLVRVGGLADGADAIEERLGVRLADGHSHGDSPELKEGRKRSARGFGPTGNAALTSMPCDFPFSAVECGTRASMRALVREAERR